MEHNGLRVIVSFVISGLILFFSIIGPGGNHSLMKSIRAPASTPTTNK